MWRRIKKRTKFQLFVAESLITSNVKDALSRTHVKHFLPREFESDPEISLNLISQPRRSED